MKLIKYLIAGLAIAFALAGCAGGSGASNFDSDISNYGTMEVGLDD